MKQVILQNTPLVPWLEQQLASEFELLQLHKQADPDAFVARHGERVTGFAGLARIGAPTSLLERLPNLRVISSVGVGYDKYDLAYLHGRGIPVGYTPDVLNDCVADTAFGLVIDVARRYPAADAFARRGEWPKGAFPMTTKVSGKKLGILGLGRIGRVVARRASGFDMEVRYHNRRPVQGAPYEYAASLVDLARWCDFLVVIAAGGDATRHIVDDKVLDALGPRGYLVNVARGSVVDEQALIRALRERRIAGAGLDVYQDEPNIPEALLALDNTVLLPHVASATNETRQAMAEAMLHNLRTFFAAGQVPVAVPFDA